MDAESRYKHTGKANLSTGPPYKGDIQHGKNPKNAQVGIIIAIFFGRSKPEIILVYFLYS
jgi:hypothetical protein